MPKVPDRPLSHGEILYNQRQRRTPICLYIPNRGDFKPMGTRDVPITQEPAHNSKSGLIRISLRQSSRQQL